ncbi:MAG: 4Fe-4S binding protein [Rubrimonas sp.]|uniref:4Fe-4S binding protein n=1 Tax=Rubrimonas sp. TaxID=2036015 RepID=UPI002FDE3957
MPPTPDARCPARLTPVRDGDAPLGGVLYRAEDRVLVLADGPEGLEVARLLGPDREATLVAPGLDGGDAEAVRRIPGRVAGLKGWLGAFLAHVARDADSHPVAHPADVVIDLQAAPAIAAAIPPLGYLRARPEDAEAVAAQARALKGTFHKPKYFAYDASICAHDVGGARACSRCLDVCDAEAIRSEGGRILVEPTLCQGCATCALACPTGALSVADPSRAALLDRVAQAGAGPLRVGPGGDLALTSAAQLGEELWFAALAQGAAGVSLGLGPDAPPRQRATLQARAAAASIIAEAFGLGAAAVALDAEATAAPRAGPPLAAAGKRALLQTALSQLEPEGFEGVALPGGATLGAIAVDAESCILCGVCAKVCPTGAVRYAEAERATLDFAEGLCIQCGACARNCPKDAIALVPGLSPASLREDWREVNSGAMARCVETGAPFISQAMLDEILRRAREGGFLTPAFEAQMRRAPEARGKSGG